MSKIQLRLFSLFSALILGEIGTASVNAAPVAKSPSYSLDLPELIGLEPATANLQAQAPAPAVEEKKPEEKPLEKKETNAFSINTKLSGEVIFGLNTAISGDSFRRAPIFGQRTRLELETEVGSGTLTTRLQSTGFGLVNNNLSNIVQTPEGSASFADGDTSSAVGIDLLKYDVALGPNTQLTVAANAAGADDFTDSINPFFDGDGGSGSISRFGGRPAIYYLVSGTGVGIRQKLGSTLEGSIGYLASTANDPATGLTGGGLWGDRSTHLHPQ
jgi:Carbohydrate-selective porin, OprB family